MREKSGTIDMVRAALAPHGLLLRGILHFDGDGPELDHGAKARTVILIGNAGGSIWPAFSAWRAGAGSVIDHPLDTWSMTVIRPVAALAGGQAWFPSEKPWQPFQQWAMRAEGLKASPLGLLVHPEFGLWHGYRGAIGFDGRLGTASEAVARHPCDHCPGKPCLISCPVGAINTTRFELTACRSHLRTAQGEAGCMTSGCLARNACPVGADFRYPPEQLRFHMAALG